MQKRNTNVLIIGAGPFGLAAAAGVRAKGLDCIVLGKPFEFWKNNMPQGMYLRSGIDWNLDPNEVFTLERFIREQGITDYEPIALGLYQRYLDWFADNTRPDILPQYATLLRRGQQGFEVRLDDGSTVQARQVLVATGFRHFAHFPDALIRKLPAGRYSHTCHSVDLEPYAGRRVAIIGGRQSAFEWAALLREAGAGRVDLIYRHPTPRFAAADWDWVQDRIAQIESNPGWFGRLSADEKEAERYKLWAEGRLKIEPWLEARVMQPNVFLHPQTELSACELSGDGSIRLTLNGETPIDTDHILLATGYKADLAQLDFLDPALLEEVETGEGYPVLDPGFQSSVPGLYFTSFLAARDFGPFMAFTVSVAMSARVFAAVAAGA